MRIALSATGAALVLLCTSCASNSAHAAKTVVQAAVVSGTFVGTAVAAEKCDEVKPQSAREDCIRKIDNAERTARAQRLSDRPEPHEDFESYRKRKDAESPVAN